MSQLTIGVIADTHIPDRARRLPPAVLETFRRAKVAAILHAGDVVRKSVLDELAQIAPTYAVRGNRDFYFLRRLPTTLTLEFAGTTIGITHGHGTVHRYVRDKLRHWMHGITFEHFAQLALETFPNADVVVFGHTHYPLCRNVGGRLLCNPGSPTVPVFKWLVPSIGLIHLGEGKPRGELIYLPGP